ncbi:DUF4231 domain-containing protein [candidate division KSB1 bacterium]|nr:DUF4231 domain-containing protein [candidate division KSB1 bacterium]
MTSDDYIKQRLQDQIDWYDRKSMVNQKKFKGLRTMEIVCAAFIPFISGVSVSIPKMSWPATILTGLLGIAITIIASILTLGKHQENWIEYRTTCESLKKEKFLFLMQVEPYDKEDSFRFLVQRVETLISKENTNWAQFISKPEEKKKEERHHG